jgi:hypothetical protein
MPDNEPDELLPVGPREAGYRRLIPAVTFGVRAAALAGLVVSAGSLAVGLFDEQGGYAAAFALGGTGSSTCCGPDPH